MIEFNSNSNQHLSALLFGGVIKEKVREPLLNSEGKIVIIKSGVNKGQIKMKLVEKEIQFKGLGLKPLKEWETKTEGIYQTNEQVLSLLSLKEGPAADLCNLILKMRELNKDIQTYYDGILDKIYSDGKIRASYNHTGTSTGRLSSNNPNLQNIPK